MRGFKRVRHLRRPKVFIPLIIVVLIIAVLVSAVRSLNSPAQGDITTPVSGKAQPAPATPSPKKYSDNFITFKYPAIYSVQSGPKDSAALDSVRLISTQRRDQFVAITLARESLASDSGLNYRKSSPSIYKTELASADTYIFSKTDGTEYTGFIAHGDKVLSVSLTAVSNTDLSADYNQITDSLEWSQ